MNRSLRWSSRCERQRVIEFIFREDVLMDSLMTREELLGLLLEPGFLSMDCSAPF